MPPNRRIILVGRTGNGKSSTGNMILGERIFKADDSLDSVTEKCEVSTRLRGKREYTIVDTPGLFDPTKSFATIAYEIQRSLELCKNPHVFLLILRIGGRFSEEEKRTCDILKIIFGDLVYQHTIIVFTEGKRKDDTEFKEYLDNSDLASDLVKQCGNRVVRVEAALYADVDSTALALTNGLLEKIEKVSGDGKRVYFNEWQALQKDVIQKYIKENGKECKFGYEKQLNDLFKMFQEKRDQELKDRFRKKCVVGVITAVTVTAGGVAAAGGPVAALAAVKAAVAPYVGAAVAEASTLGATGTVVGRAASMGTTIAGHVVSKLKPI